VVLGVKALGFAFFLCICMICVWLHVLIELWGAGGAVDIIFGSIIRR
jgi:hypothetical protein